MREYYFSTLKQHKRIILLLVILFIGIYWRAANVFAGPILVVGERDDFTDTRLIEFADENPLIVFSLGQEKKLVNMLDEFEDIIFVDAMPRDFAVPAASLPLILERNEQCLRYVLQEWQFYPPGKRRYEFYVLSNDVLLIGNKMTVCIDGRQIFSQTITDDLVKKGRLILTGDLFLDKGEHVIEVSILFNRILKKNTQEDILMRMFVVDKTQRLSIQSVLEKKIKQPNINTHYIFHSNNSFYIP